MYTGEVSDAWLLDPGQGAEGYIPRFAPDPSSALYAALCAHDGDSCTFPTLVVLEETLACDGIECEIGEVTTVQMVDGDKTVYFTYQRHVCVKNLLWPNGRVTKYTRTQAPAGPLAQCANPLAEAAEPTCCQADNPTTVRATHLVDDLCFL